MIFPNNIRKPAFKSNCMKDPHTFQDPPYKNNLTKRKVKYMLIPNFHLVLARQQFRILMATSSFILCYFLIRILKNLMFFQLG